MCLGIPGRIVELVGDDNARVEVGGVRRQVSLALLERDAVALGDYVLIHVGFALARLDAAEAERTLELLSEMELLEAEMKEFGSSRG
jgi:hydrogenase expression/formation protein HypC